MTQKEIVVEYLKSLNGEWVREYNLRAVHTPFGFLGFQADRRCRELAQEGIIERRLKEKWILGHYDCEGGCWRCEDNEAIEKHEIIKIIGRPITLEDCLIAMYKILFSNESYIMVPDEISDLLGLWQLGKPLQDQPEETKTLLYNLICKK